MPTKKKPKPEPKHPPSLGDLRTKDLLRSIRDDLANKAQQAGLAYPPHPPKQRRSR